MTDSASKPVQENRLADRMIAGIKKCARGLWYVASALVLPVSIERTQKASGRKKWSLRLPIAKMAIYAAMQLVVQPLSTFMFPRAEDFLKKEGLDPKIAQQLSPGQRIHVIDAETPAGFLYTMFSSPLMLDLFRYTTKGGVVPAYTHKNAIDIPLAGLLFPHVSSFVVHESAFENLQKDDALTKKFFTQRNPDATFHSPISIEEMRLVTILHELRHTHDDNYMLGSNEREAEADLKAAFMAAAIRRDSTLPMRLALRNVMIPSSSVDHETALYIDAALQQKTLPTDAQLRASTKEADPVIQSVLYNHMMRAIQGTHVHLDPVDTSGMSPLAKRKVHLADSAWTVSLKVKN